MFIPCYIFSTLTCGRAKRCGTSADGVHEVLASMDAISMIQDIMYHELYKPGRHTSCHGSLVMNLYCLHRSRKYPNTK